MRIPWRVERANTTLLLSGVACVLVAVLGGSLSVAEVTAKGLTTVGAVVLGVVGAGLVAASFVVGVEAPKHPDEKATKGRFLGAAPRRASRYVARAELERLVETLVHADARPVALVGVGGVGKTVLAVEAVHHKKIRRRFRDGVAWLAVDPQVDVLALQSELARRLDGGEAVFRDATEGRSALAELQAHRKLLVVLDNVWEREVLDAFPPDLQILFTSRNVALAHSFNATALEVAELELEQALQLLAKWTDRDLAKLAMLPAEAICQQLERLALGVAMAGAIIGHGDDERWRDVLARLEAADLGRIRSDFGEDYPYPTLLAALELGIDELPEPARQRYRELAVFNGRGPFPRSAAEAVWRLAGLSGPDVGDLLALLEGRSLIHPEGEGRYSLHDLQADVVAHQLGPGRLIAAHVQLLNGYRPPEPADWSSVPDDGYLLGNLAYHWACAGLPEPPPEPRPPSEPRRPRLRWLLPVSAAAGLVAVVLILADGSPPPNARIVQQWLAVFNTGEFSHAVTYWRAPALWTNKNNSRTPFASTGELKRWLDQHAACHKLVDRVVFDPSKSDVVELRVSVDGSLPGKHCTSISQFWYEDYLIVGGRIAALRVRQPDDSNQPASKGATAAKSTTSTGASSSQGSSTAGGTGPGTVSAPATTSQAASPGNGPTLTLSAPLPTPPSASGS